MKCVECGQRKGKRFCPARNSGICPQCCGKKRVVEIPCPPECPFLKSGQTYYWLKKYISMLQSQEDPSRRQRLFETSQQFHEFLGSVEKVIVKYAAGLSSFADTDALEAIRSLKATYLTEQKGVIYEHTSSNPLAQALTKDLRKAIETYRTESTEASASLRTADIVACLELIEVDIDYHLSSASARDTYLGFIARSHPDSTGRTDQGGIVVVP